MTNVMGINNFAMFSCLGIRTIVSFLPDPPKEQPGFVFNHFPLQEWIPYDEIVTHLQEAEKPILMYCLNGKNYSPAVCAAYFARKKGVPG